MPRSGLSQGHGRAKGCVGGEICSRARGMGERAAARQSLLEGGGQGFPYRHGDAFGETGEMT